MVKTLAKIGQNIDQNWLKLVKIGQKLVKKWSKNGQNGQKYGQNWSKNWAKLTFFAFFQCFVSEFYSYLLKVSF